MVLFARNMQFNGRQDWNVTRGKVPKQRIAYLDCWTPREGQYIHPLLRTPEEV